MELLSQFVKARRAVTSKTSKKRPPAKLRADARANRERLLATAHELFSAKGFSIEMDEIARGAGVGKGTLYRHFPTKETLFQEIVAVHIARMVDDGRESLDASDAGDAFFRYLERCVASTSAKRDLVDALARDGVAVRERNDDAVAEFRECMAALLQRAQRASAVRLDLSIDELIWLLSGLMTSSEREGVTVKSRYRMLQVLLDGLRAR
jgi:AcrR family transcriptional regulator